MKEKLGGLRVYYDLPEDGDWIPIADAVNSAIEHAEKQIEEMYED